MTKIQWGELTCSTSGFVGARNTTALPAALSEGSLSLTTSAAMSVLPEPERKAEGEELRDDEVAGHLQVVRLNEVWKAKKARLQRHDTAVVWCC